MYTQHCIGSLTSNPHLESDSGVGGCAVPHNDAAAQDGRSNAAEEAADDPW